MNEPSANQTTAAPDLRDEAENLSQWMVFLGEQAKDIPRLVRAAGVMRDLIAENKRLRADVAMWRNQFRRENGGL